MKLYRSQNAYDNFNRSMSEIFDTELTQSDFRNFEVENPVKVSLGFEFKKGNQFGKLNKGVKFSEEHRENLRIVNTGKKMSVESSEKKRQAMIGKTGPNKGKKLSESWRKRMSDSSLGKSKSQTHSKNLGTHLNSLPKMFCPHCGLEGRMAPMKRWHFENCKNKPVGI